MTDFFAKNPNMPDLTGVSILVCTPCHDGKYERDYMRSLYATGKEIERLGGKITSKDLPFCADIGLARAKLLGVFYRGDYTHLLFIDADMGWEFQDVIRLVLSERDFIGGAGPKKVYPKQFAANLTDDFGNPQPLMQEGTGIVEVNEVGLAFMLISRDCVDRMVKAYPELEFNGDKDETEYALFDSIVINRRRMSEDYAFCRRWSKLGGKVQLLPDIKMTHTGSHTFSGALSDTFED